MKKYNVKYEVGQEVYVLESKKIIKSPIDKIRISEQGPYVKGNHDGTFTEKDGVEIEYLVEASRNACGKGHSYTYDWFNQEDVFSNKEELIAQIK